MKSSIKRVIDFLTQPNLHIPEYQRPYKWGIKNINQLIDDILLFNDKKSYRLGTVVLHEDGNNLSIVDGQQRTITLFLIAYAIKSDDNKKEFLKKDIEIDWRFENKISQYNIQQNYQEIQRRLKDLDEKTIKFLFEKCEVVVVTLDDVSEAFQFFDSQNARGKDLEPHDLLKAFHLREMSNVEEVRKTKIIEKWESIDADELSEFFEKYLFRIKNWSKNRSARFFTKNDIDIFKGIKLVDRRKYPSSKVYTIANFYVDNYNSDYHRNIDDMVMEYPFGLDQPLINGKRFFEMISYYKKLEEEIQFKFQENETLQILDSYKGRYRTGDKYVRNLFDCALLYYIDKFGEIDIEKAIEKFFIWAYSLRLKQHSVQLASMDNYARVGNSGMFNMIREANSHKDIINMHIDIVDNVVATKVSKIEKKFRRLNYVK
jgi:uncharacterized protein with ParB-like and HNH nuclease domain